MHSGQVYPALSRALDHWSALPTSELRTLVGAKPMIEELEVDGELIQIEVSVAWANMDRNTLLLEAVAYGPANWLTERMAEKVRIKLTPTDEDFEGRIAT